MSLTWDKTKDVLTRKVDGMPLYQREGVCLSGDDKPTTCVEGGVTIGIENGSKLIEMDSGTLHLFDTDNQKWWQFGGEGS